MSVSSLSNFRYAKKNKKNQQLPLSCGLPNFHVARLAGMFKVRTLCLLWEDDDDAPLGFVIFTATVTM